MNIIIDSSIHTLNKSKALLFLISNDVLSDTSVSPYYSCVGSHIRHILDFYDCILVKADIIDLTARKRQLEVEKNCDTALQYLEEIIERIKKVDANTLNRNVLVIDDLGLGKAKIVYTFSSLLAQANSHSIHHYAIINYILNRLGFDYKCVDFGYNPSTPK